MIDTALDLGLLAQSGQDVASDLLRFLIVAFEYRAALVIFLHEPAQGVGNHKPGHWPRRPRLAVRSPRKRSGELLMKFGGANLLA